MNKGIMVIEERGDRRYGRIVAGSADGSGAPSGRALRECLQQPPCVPSTRHKFDQPKQVLGSHFPSKGGGSVGGAEERKARFCADEDVEILTAANQMRKEQRRRDAAMAQRKKKTLRKQRIVKAVCRGIDVLAYVSCLFAFVLLMLTQNRLIAIGMLAMAAVYALFTMRLEKP